jgi:hypothetical protein
MEIKKIETCNYVMFPRTQLPGLTCDDNALIPSRQDFDVELIHNVPNMGTVKMIIQQAPPHMTFQLFEPKSMQQFDDFLSKLLGMHESPAYVADCLDFIVLFQGCRDGIEISQQNYKAVVAQIHATRDAAARWWYEYGNDKSDMIF